MAISKIKQWETADSLILLEGWARSGLTDEQIMHNMGISNYTFYEWKKKSSKINEALKKKKEIVDYEVENALLKNALNGNVTAQIFWLKNRKKFEWREKVETSANNEELSKVEKLLNKIEQEAEK